jgi:hypothetical protein
MDWKPVLLSALLILAGIYMLLGIWFPRLRCEYKGSRTPVGSLASASFAFVAISWGLAVLWQGLLGADGNFSFAWFAVPFVLGAIGVICGEIRDRRFHREFSHPPVLTTSVMRPRTARLTGLCLAIGLGYLLYSAARGIRANYWLLQDTQQGMAVVTRELPSGHNWVAYKYTVAGNEYTGESARSWRDRRYAEVRVGEKSVVFFSSSHPWVSTLRMPDGIVEGMPVVLVVLVLEFFAIATVANPYGKWAINFTGRR